MHAWSHAYLALALQCAYANKTHNFIFFKIPHTVYNFCGFRGRLLTHEDLANKKFTT